MAGLLSLIGSGFAVFPRHPDLRAFDPAAMAHSEITMWRHYYERRYLWLFADLYDNSRAQYGFSPWDSLVIIKNGIGARKWPLDISRVCG
jgi:hypothetical protein